MSTKWLKTSLNSRLPSTDASDIPTEPLLGSANINLGLLTNGSKIVGPLIVGMTAASSAAPLAVVGGLGVIATAGDRLISWTQFLNPLIQSKSECLTRVLILNQQHTLSKSLYFKAYFNVLPQKDILNTDMNLYIIGYSVCSGNNAIANCCKS